MIRKSVLVLTVFALCAACATTSGSKKMYVEVEADPEGASVSYRGTTLGSAPISFRITSIKDVLDIDARLEGQALVEKRVRVTSDDSIEVSFRFGDEESALAKALGLTRVVVFDYSDRTTFDLEQATLKPKFLPMLEQQAELLNTAFADLDVFVCGFTDTTGTSDFNLDLSLRRAEAVSEFLKSRGVSGDRLKIQGFGESYPIARNDTREGRALNRRTEIVLPQ